MFFFVLGEFFLCLFFYQGDTQMTRYKESSMIKQILEELNISSSCHQVVLIAQSSLILYSHLSLSSITPDRSSRLYPVTTQSRYIQVLPSQPTLTHLWARVHKKMSHVFILTSPACLVCLTWMIREMGGKFPYSCNFVGVLLPGFIHGST